MSQGVPHTDPHPAGSAAELSARLSAELDLELATATYVVRCREEAEALEGVTFAAVHIDDPALGIVLPQGPGSHVVLVNVPRLPLDLAKLVERTDVLLLPPHWRNCCEYLEWPSSLSLNEAEVSERRGRWLAFARESVRRSRSQQVPAKPAKPYRLRSISEIRSLPPVRWIVPGLLPAPSFGFVISPPNTGKTTLALGWMLSALYHRPWCGRPVQPGSVVLVAGEGIPGLPRRIAPWERDHAGGHTDDNRYFVVLDGLPALSSPAGIAALAAAIDELVARHGHAPSIVSIDTLASLWGGESEDRSEFAGPAMAALGRLAERHGMAFVLLHHTTKPNADRGSGLTLASLRGSSAFAGAADFVLGLEPTPDGARLLTLKQKDAERAQPIHLRLQKVDLGQDDHGSTATGVYYVPAATPSAVDTTTRSLDDDARDHVRAIVAKLRELGSVPSANSVVRRLKGRRPDLLAAFKEAVACRKIVNTGTAREPRFVVADGVCVAPPHTPPQPGTGSLAGAPATSLGGAGTSGNQGGTAGNRQGTAPEPAVQPSELDASDDAGDLVHDGLPQQGGGKPKHGGRA